MMRKAWPGVVAAILLIAVLWLRSPGPARPAAPPPELTKLPVNFIPSPPPAPAPAASRVPPPPLDPETREHCLSSLRWLVNAQNPDGSWGDGTSTLEGVLIGKTGMTGLALTALMGAGYTHLSKDA